MKVLVTGGAGYIGSHTCKALAREGHDPIVFDNLSTGHKRFVRYGPLVIGDLNDPSSLMSAFEEHRPEAVIHFAASAYVGESVQRPRAYYRNNVCGTLNLLDAMHAFNVRRLVFSSSCATYGIPETMPIGEETTQAPINPYGRTKLICEQMMRDMAEAAELDCIALRYFNAAGADPDGELGEVHDPETHALPLMLMAIAGLNSDFRIMGSDYPTMDGTCIRDYLHVSDLASAHVCALQRLTSFTGFDAINLGTGTGHSVKEMVTRAQDVTGKPLPHQYVGRRAGDPPELVADPSRARAVLNWSPRHSDLPTIIGTAWSWLQNETSARTRNPDQV